MPTPNLNVTFNHLAFFLFDLITTNLNNLLAICLNTNVSVLLVRITLEATQIKRLKGAQQINSISLV
jgi:hypothetical protein